MTDFFPFVNDTGNNSSSKSHLHKRSFSESDACFGSEDGPFCGGAHRPCHYFARGFCKNGSGCKFVHSCHYFARGFCKHEKNQVGPPSRGSWMRTRRVEGEGGSGDDKLWRGRRKTMNSGGERWLG
ncbi:hypothetical protein CDL15_Pgr018804 [Punica granatum]|uniref:C3H1-type domain-containing protein n=1 Tax=Punica granatum TaxID=22663 RepID=A0A218VWG7_PUNGR|nr:hypothetical protein CDL15_Pgr018804 [Punica granatum]